MTKREVFVLLVSVLLGLVSALTYETGNDVSGPLGIPADCGVLGQVLSMGENVTFDGVQDFFGNFSDSELVGIEIRF